MKKNIIFILLILYFLTSCSKDKANPITNIPEINIPNYFGTYLYDDDDCSGADIQYATIDQNGITFFDFLGDGCDDTVSCYAQETYELTEVSTDTFFLESKDGSNISNVEIFISADSSIKLSYTGNNGIVEYYWNKIKDEIYPFDPICDKEYEATKDVADMLVYAVNTDGDLLWKNYIHGGIWDLGSSVTPLNDGGYMILGVFEGIEWGGCCYTLNGDQRDIIKLDAEGKIVWKKEIEFSNNGEASWYKKIGKSLIQTSYGDLVFLTPGGSGGVNVIMMDADGVLKWSTNYLSYSSWNYNMEIIETEDGDLALVTGGTARFSLLDYDSGEILEEVEYEGLNYPRAIVNVDGDFAMIGRADEENEPIFLLKISDDGEEMWRKIWSDDTTKPRKALDLIHTADDGYLLFCYSDPHPYATLIKTDEEGNEEWRKKYADYIGGSQGWIHKTDDGGYFMASGYAVTKLNINGDVEWNAAAPTGFDKFFNNDMVSGINYDMKKIDGGAVMCGYGSASWE